MSREKKRMKEAEEERELSRTTIKKQPCGREWEQRPRTGKRRRSSDGDEPELRRAETERSCMSSRDYAEREKSMPQNI